MKKTCHCTALPMEGPAIEAIRKLTTPDNRLLQEVLKISLGCLFIALVLNTGFTHAQMLVTTGTNMTTNSTWLQIHSLDDPNGMDAANQPERTVIVTSAQPVVQQMSPKLWKITFKP